MEKKLRKSPLAVILYIVSALLLVYSCYLIGSTIVYIFSYYGQYSMAPGIAEVASYVLQSAYQPLVFAFLTFAAARILNEVRALNPSYYTSKEEMKAAKEMKKNAGKEVEEVKETVETEVKPNASMKKAELLEIAKKQGIEVSSKATKADILEALNK